MKKIQILSMYFFALACTSCMAASNAEHSIKVDHVMQEIEMRSGEVVRSEYEQKSAIGKYVVLSSEIASERVVIIRADKVGQLVPFGYWSNIQEIQSDDVDGLIDIYEKIARREVVIAFDLNPAVAEEKDALGVDIPKSDRKLFDAAAAAKKCSSYIETGALPRRAFKRNETYVLDCVLPGMADSGYLVFASNGKKAVRITKVDFYQYDRIPMQGL